MATLETIALCHPMDYVEHIRDASPKEGMVRLDADTSMSPGTFEAALRAAGGAVLRGRRGDDRQGRRMRSWRRARPAIMPRPRRRWASACSTTPRSRRATRRRQHGAERVAIVDFDVHHGNGTQEIFWTDASVMYCSTHQMPLYPGTGAVSERGDARHHRQRAAARRATAATQFREAMESVILPRLEGFAPDLVIISAGFDAHMRDPLANLQLARGRISPGRRRS